jgi:hypothetical protein
MNYLAEMWWALRGNENRARSEVAGVRNRMSPCDGTGVAPPRSHNDLPPPIRGDAPMTLDPHANARHSNENRTVAPAEKSRSSYTSEVRRRLHSTSGDSYK